MKKFTRKETAKIFGPGCRIDFERNIVYGADGNVYEDVQINREDLERLLREEKAKT